MSQQINLANPQLLKKRYALGLREMLMALGVVLVGALGWAGLLHYQAGTLETQAEQQEALQASAQQELDELNAAASRGVNLALTNQVKQVQNQVAQREALLAAISGTLEQTSAGFSPRLRALAMSATEGVWLNGFNLSMNHIELKGSAFNAGLLTTYIEQLGKQAPFAGVKFSGMTAAMAKTGKADNSNPPGETAAPVLPDYLDFSLSAGSADGSADQESVDAR
jgi:Tfp pilus assembly protein PilN